MKKYALCLHDNNRIHHACVALPGGDYGDMPIVETLPEGNPSDYLYINGEYVHDPLLEQTPDEPVEPTPTLEERVSAVEDQLAFTKIILGVE